MDKKELLVRLEIAEGELKDYTHSEDVEIQLDKSVHIIHCDEQEYIDGIYLSGTTTEVHFTASSFDGSEIYCYDIYDIGREDIIKVVKELIKMCKED